MELIFGVSEVFAKTTTYSVLNLGYSDVVIDKSTYEIELEVFQQINQIRIQEDINPLYWDPLLSTLARSHSFDISTYSYVIHTNLLGQGVEERAKLLGIKNNIEINQKTYLGFGENIGFMPQGIVKDVGVIITPEDVASAQVLEWMISQGHRENILFEKYFYTGIGVEYGGRGNFYLTQVFQ